MEARGSVALKMRVPMGAESLKYYADAKNSMFLISFSSGATAIEVLYGTPHYRAHGALHSLRGFFFLYHSQAQVSRALGDVEDSFFTFSPPALRNQKPSINENEMFVKLLGLDIVAPRCVLPIGPGCKDDSTAQGDASTEAGGRKQPSRTLREGGEGEEQEYDPWSDPFYDPYAIDEYGVEGGSSNLLPGGRHLQAGEHVRALAVYRRGRRLAAADDEAEAESCIVATAGLYSASVQFIYFETTIIVCTCTCVAPTQANSPSLVSVLTPQSCVRVVTSYALQLVCPFSSSSRLVAHWMLPSVPASALPTSWCVQPSSPKRACTWRWAAVSRLALSRLA